MSERVERVRGAVEEPLLVTKPVNVLWLTGLDSSNAAVLVEPDRVRIFTDFRYVEKAKATGLEVVEIPRSLYTRLPELLPKRVAFESEQLPYASWAAIDAGGVETVPTTRAAGDGARGQGAGRAGRDPPGGGDHERDLRPPGRGALHRPHREGARLVGRADDARPRRRGRGVPADRRLRAERRAAAREPAATSRSSRARRSSSTPPRRSTATTRTARGRSRRASCRTSSRAPTTSAWRRSSRGSRRRGPARSAGTSTRSPAR